tara:strand:+ start:156 stop:563 length:408 start_codon:yes stop_codon:yes gene_type:complete
MPKVNKKQKKIVKMLKQFERDKYCQTFYEQIHDIKKIFNFMSHNYIQTHSFQFIKNYTVYYNFFYIAKKKARDLLEKLETTSREKSFTNHESILIKNTIIVLKDYLQKDKYYTKVFLYISQLFEKDIAFLILDYL